MVVTIKDKILDGYVVQPSVFHRSDLTPSGARSQGVEQDFCGLTGATHCASLVVMEKTRREERLHQKLVEALDLLHLAVLALEQEGLKHLPRLIEQKFDEIIEELNQ